MIPQSKKARDVLCMAAINDSDYFVFDEIEDLKKFDKEYCQQGTGEEVKIFCVFTGNKKFKNNDLVVRACKEFIPKAKEIDPRDIVAFIEVNTENYNYVDNPLGWVENRSWESYQIIKNGLINIEKKNWLG